VGVKRTEGEGQMNIQDFKTKKIAVSFTDDEQGKKDRRTFLKVCEAEGMKWCTGQKATDDNLNWECIDYFPDMALTGCDRGYYESLGYSIVPFAFFALKKPRPDKLTAIRDGNDQRITVTSQRASLMALYGR